MSYRQKKSTQIAQSAVAESTPCYILKRKKLQLKDAPGQ
jgi:hypothetical protein